MSLVMDRCFTNSLCICVASFYLRDIFDLSDLMSMCNESKQHGVVIIQDVHFSENCAIIKYTP